MSSQRVLISPTLVAARLKKLAIDTGTEAEALAKASGEPLAESTPVWESLAAHFDNEVEASLVALIDESRASDSGSLFRETDIQVPRITAEKADDRRGTFVIGPLDKGFGYTFGNSLRRVLLSSLGGAAITSVRIEGIPHEFSSVPGVKEDVTDIILNLKDLVVRMHADADEVQAPLVTTGPGKVTARDIDLPSSVEILNPDAPIATLEKKAKLEVYLTIGRGRGYSPAEENKTEGQPIGMIPIDSIFSPIRRASYAVSAARVGRRTDFDKLTLDLETDGSIEPGAALREAAEILIQSLAIFTDAHRVEELTARESAAALPAEPSAHKEDRPRSSSGLDEILIEELELGVRSYNCLKRAGVQTVGDLVRKTRSELNAIPNFGQKSIEEVIETLHSRGLNLGRGDADHERS